MDNNDGSEIKERPQERNDRAVWAALVQAYQLLNDHRPTDRSPKARYYAVANTDLEKLMAYFQTYVLNGRVSEAFASRDYACTVPAGEDDAPPCPRCGQKMVWSRTELPDEDGWTQRWRCDC